MTELETGKECRYGNFVMAPEGELLEAREKMRATSPDLAEMLDRAEQNLQEPYAPTSPSPTRSEIAGEFVRVVVPRAALALASVVTVSWLLFGTEPSQSQPPREQPQHLSQPGLLTHN